MSDIMLPQVPPAPLPPKASAAPASAKPAEPPAESQADQGFSDVLQTRMQPEDKAAETAPAKPATTPVPGEEQTAAAAADGKPLPSGGKVVSAVIAALTEPAEASQATQASIDPAQQASVPLPAGIAVLFPAEDSRPKAGGRIAPQQASVQAQTRAHAGPTGVPQHLPEVAQGSVAQAVREALTETGETTLPRPAGEVFAAHVRAAATAQGRGASVDGALERLIAQPAQPAQSSAAVPQAVTTALPQEVLAGARPLLPATTLETPFRQPGWDQALSERVLWVANQRFQGAEIKLNPPQLGPIEVRVQLQHEQAQISFTAQNASVREALEAALPRLREMFAANGFNLLDVNVSQHSFAEQQRQTQAQAGDPHTGTGGDDDGDPAIALHQELARTGAAARGGIDLFA